MTTAEPDDSTGCGDWASDPDGLPEFRIDVTTCPPEAWHLVGSPGLAALVHVSGAVSLWATRGGMVRLADRSIRIVIDGETPQADAVAFGTDRARWATTAGTTRVVSTIVADPDSPVLHLTWSIETASATTVGLRCPIDAVPIVAAPLMSRRVPPPATHTGSARWVWRAMFTGSDAARRATDAVRERLGARHPLVACPDPAARTLTWAPAANRATPDRPRLFVAVPPSLRLHVDHPPDELSVDLDTTGMAVTIDGPGRHRLTASLTLDDPIPFRGVQSASTPTPPARWDRVPEPLGREAIWHLARLRALRVPDPFTGGRFVMQGSAYGFVHGLHGALRDEAFVVAALAHIDETFARETLIAMLAQARPDGTFHYAHTGYGTGLSGGVHAAPTDLGLFCLWALDTYVTATGDAEVLDEPVRLRGTRRTTRTVGAIALAAARSLDTAVGCGPHGMLRVGSGDWADPISLMVPRRRAFHRFGESTFNTAMALAVLPGAADLLEPLDPSAAARCRALVDRLDRTLESAWTGRWYLRGWDGRGGPIGADHCFLDAQVWAVIAGHGRVERRAALVETMGRLLDDPSPVGPTIIDRPHRVRLGMLADGWDCNGGVWAALGGLAAWAFALHDEQRAWATLQQQSMARRRQAYPDVWYGQWSGPDATNAHFGDRPGETFVHPATPMTEFPTSNSNAHAGPLLGLAATLAATERPADDHSASRRTAAGSTEAAWIAGM